MQRLDIALIEYDFPAWTATQDKYIYEMERKWKSVDPTGAGRVASGLTPYPQRGDDRGGGIRKAALGKMAHHESLDPTAGRASDPLRRALAWGVHLFTASGAVVALLALLAITRQDFGQAIIYMLIALTIDSLDGSMARRVGVTVHAPTIDGRRLDDIVDYLNFVIVPVFFMIQASSILSPYLGALPVLASAYGFSRVDAKTEDDFFLGFPSYWNVLALYLYLLDYSAMTGTLWLTGLSVAVFVPIKYIYPSRIKKPMLRHFTNYTGLLWAIVVGWAVLNPELAARFHVVPVSLVYPAYYVGLSFLIGGYQRRPPVS
jgi:phosphatidylcholine synthase